MLNRTRARLSAALLAAMLVWTGFAPAPAHAEDPPPVSGLCRDTNGHLVPCPPQGYCQDENGTYLDGCISDLPPCDEVSDGADCVSDWYLEKCPKTYDLELQISERHVLTLQHYIANWRNLVASKNRLLRHRAAVIRELRAALARARAH